MSDTTTAAPAQLNLVPLAQENAWRSLVQMADALPQGLILVGPSGVGKRRAAKALFQLLGCQKRGSAGAAEAESSLFGGPPEPATSTEAATEPCGECASCRKIAEGRHADLIEILPKGDNIAVDELREMKKSLYFPPIDGRYRFVIIDEAHKLNAASANTLLKTLEEPPAHTRFFLITHERGLLLPTIISRCQFLYFSPLGNETLKELLRDNGYEIPEHLLPTCLQLMAGGLDRAELLASEKTLAFIETAQRAMVASNPRWEEITALAEQLSSGGSEEEWKLELLLDMLVLQWHRNALASRGREEALKFVNRALDAAYLRRRLERHANKKLIALAAADLATTGARARLGGAP